ncbi:MAG: hypothetical protein AAF804_10020, partial [Bacteroidota bacterium]
MKRKPDIEIEEKTSGKGSEREELKLDFDLEEGAGQASWKKHRWGWWLLLTGLGLGMGIWWLIEARDLPTDGDAQQELEKQTDRGMARFHEQQLVLAEDILALITSEDEDFPL